MAQASHLDHSDLPSTLTRMMLDIGIAKWCPFDDALLPAANTQAEDRLHRRGQQTAVNVTLLLAHYPVESAPDETDISGDADGDVSCEFEASDGVTSTARRRPSDRRHSIIRPLITLSHS